jgi:hypothetical protein
MSDPVTHAVEFNGKELKLLKYALVKYSETISARDNESYASFRRIKRMLEKVDAAKAQK